MTVYFCRECGHSSKFPGSATLETTAMCERCYNAAFLADYEYIVDLIKDAVEFGRVGDSYLVPRNFDFFARLEDALEQLDPDS